MYNIGNIKSAEEYAYCRNNILLRGDFMLDQKAFAILSEMRSFNFGDFFAASKNSGSPLGEASVRKKLQSLLKDGEIIRVGRNAYCIPADPVSRYYYEYSETARSTAQVINETYPSLNFTIFELIQLNEFVNHQLAHNALFLSVEEDLSDFVFETLKEHFPGKVLLDPTPELYHKYWYDDMIVIEKLVTEAPLGCAEPWHTRLEKLLIDLISDPLLTETVSESEIPTILEDAFAKYVIDESCLFRYAKRRGAENRFKTIVREKTNIALRTE